MPTSGPDAPVTTADFHATPGVEDWRVLGSGLHARWLCRDLAEAAAFASALAAATVDAPRTPDIDLRAGSVTLHLPEHSDLHSFVVASDVVTATTAQRLAREAGLEPDPGSLRQLQLAVAHAPGVEVREFWQAVLGWVPLGEEDAQDPHERGPRLWFHEIGHGRPGRGRTHIDVYLPAEQAEAVVEAAVAAGGRIADGSHAPDWWTLASPDNHGIDVAAWPDR